MLPVYNGARTLALAIQTILNQDYKHWELIILDDASQDNSVEVIKRYEDDRIHVVLGKRNIGLSARLNMAVEMAKGKYIARMDQDDVSYSNRIRKQVEFLEENLDVDLLATGLVVFRGNGQVLGRLPVKKHHDEICHKPWRGFYLPHPTWMGRIEWFRKHQYKSFADGSEDQHLLFRVFSESHYECLDEVLFGYREGNRTLKKMFNSRKSFLKSFLHECVSRKRPIFAFLIIFDQLIKLSGDMLNIILKIPGARNRLLPLSNKQEKTWKEQWQEFSAKSHDSLS